MTGAQKTVLVVEDDRPLGQALSDKITRAGHRAVWVKSGGDALKEAEKVRPDLILLDILIPDQSGLGVLKEIREQSWGARVPVVVLTNMESMEMTAAALDSGVHNYYVKSHTEINEVMKTVERELKGGPATNTK